MRSVQNLDAVNAVAGRIGGKGPEVTPKPLPPVPMAPPNITVKPDLSGAIAALDELSKSQMAALSNLSEQNRIVMDGIATKLAELLAEKNAIGKKSYTIESVIVRDQNMRMKSIKSIVTTEG